ncbi:hypothetical protein MNBD_ALPHA02-2108 [hydrothermal vent metagenome]|uniref:CENP-V/GFA domain-containing protein n=1 Tax=hydrothermal vent metagenome TaxID=652676 RepID=A0A3B0R2L0_9ZZZZ
MRFTFETTIDVPEMALRRCSCSFCRKQGGRYTSDPNGKLSIEISDADSINRYNFGHKTADFINCTICGGLPFFTSEINGNCFAVINVNCLDKVDQLTENDTLLSSNMETKEHRLARRKKNWIGNVTYK